MDVQPTSPRYVFLNLLPQLKVGHAGAATVSISRAHTKKLVDFSAPMDNLFHKQEKNQFVDTLFDDATLLYLCKNKTLL